MAIEKHYRRRDVEVLTGFARSTIYDMISRGEFPRPVKITGKAVAWPESAVAAWLADRQTA